jgi:hypothetical protein
MDILKKIYLLPLALLVTSCYEEIDINVAKDYKLCLNSVITAGEPIEVDVTHTWLYTDESANNNHAVTDATLAIYANGELKDADYLPQKGDVIRIVANSPTYGSAEAEVTVPMSVPVTFDWSLTPTSFWMGEDEEYSFETSIGFNLNATMVISDTAGVDNYYRFSYNDTTNDGYTNGNDNSDNNNSGDDNYYDGLGETYYNLYVGLLDKDIEPIFSEHIGTFEEVSGSEVGRFLFFTDRQFSGKSYTLHLCFKDGGYSLYTNDFSEDKLDFYVTMTLTTMSQSYYNWANYLWQIGEGMLGDLSDVGLADGMGGYSNVSTGAGVVVAQTRKTFTINLKDTLKNIFAENGAELPVD